MYLGRVVFWGPESGGRYIPPQSGYRPQIEIGKVHTSCFVYSIDDVETFTFDREYIVKLELMFPEKYGGQLRVGDQIKLYEGNKQIGEGEILELLESELKGPGLN